MQVSCNRASAIEAPVWDSSEGTPQAVAGLLAQGCEVRPLCSSRGEKAQFLAAEWLFVEFTRPTAAVAALVSHPFTVRHAAVVCIGRDDRGNQACVFGFQLPQRLSDPTRYRQLLSGLATVYATTPPNGALSAWRCAGGAHATTLQGVVDEAALDRLASLGKENSAHRSSNSYVRSTVRLDREANVQARGGGIVPLVSLDEGTAVHCPVHVDTTGVATVIGQGNTKAVQCPVCTRNYWNVPYRPSVDFGHFRRVFGELHARELATEQEDRQFTLLREAYLPPLELHEGVTLVRSRKGSGKTTVLKALADECHVRSLSILLVGHRRALLRAQSQRIDLDLYFETLDGGGSAEFRAVRPTDRYAICLDSMPSRLRPDVHKFDVVLVDESEQVIRHLAGSTLKDGRRHAFMKFTHYLSAAKAVYLLDADLGMLSLSLALETAHVASTVRFIINEPEEEPREYELVTSREGLMAKLQAALDNGDKCYVATNSKAAAERIGLWIADGWKGKRVEVVTSDNAQAPRIQDMLCNIVEEYQSGRDGRAPLDVLVGSPAIGTGIDITFPDNAVVVEQVFGLFEGNITTHFDIDQQLGRVRHPGNVTVWINRNVMHYETAPAALRNELRNTVLRTDVLVGFSRDGLPIYSDNDKPLVNLWSEIVAHERASKNDLLQHWTALREANGWTGILGATSDAEKQRGKAALQGGKALRDAERVDRVVSAVDIDRERAEELKEMVKAGAPMTMEDQASLEKYRLSEFYAAEVDAGLVAFDNDGRTRRCVETLEVMVGDNDFNRGIDMWEIDLPDKRRVVAFDRQFRCAKAEMLAQLLSAAGLFDSHSCEFAASALVSTDSLGGFVACMRDHRKRVETELGIDVRRDLERKPVQQLGDILALVGVDLVLALTTKVKGVKRRCYGVDSEGLGALMAVIARREQQRQERRELALQAKADDGDNDPPSVNNEPGEQLSPDDDRKDSAGATAQGSPMAARLAALRAGKRHGTAKNLPASVNPKLDISNLPFSV